jgi:hypothetical protein
LILFYKLLSIKFKKLYILVDLNRQNVLHFELSDVKFVFIIFM